MRRAIAVALLSIGSFSQAISGRAQDVVRRLMPEGNPRRLVMPKPSEGARVIHQLRVAQTTARGDQAQQVAFLLAVFGSDYQRNRDYLLWVLKGCEVPEIKHGCNDMTGEYLFYLYEQGHPDILAPLLNSSVKSYSAAGAESLGELFADLVVKSPKDFLGAVRLFPPSTQSKDVLLRRHCR